VAGRFGIVLPAKNEAASLRRLLPEIRRLEPEADITVVNDGSSDDTEAVCAELGVRCLSHPYSMGNGAAVKSGARHVEHDVLVFMDADGQHDPATIRELVAALERGYDMAVGARSWDSHASLGRRLANFIYNRLATWMTGRRVEDLTSGFRAVRRRHFLRFLYLLPNGFSYPTTCTMAFFRSGLPVAYVPTAARSRSGRSHIRLLEDGLRFLMIILKVGALFSPMRLFLPVSALIFTVGALYYGWTFAHYHRFTNMSALLFTTAILTFMIGILAELVSALHYKEADFERRLIRRGDGSDAGESERSAS
jgi:glycosyltransferase involved in cell wall biosynthesis